MISNVVVSYTLRPEAMTEHVALIEGVFAQLRAEQVTDVEYKVLRLEDGVSFVHVSTADTPDGSNPLPSLSAFREFSREIGSRIATPPAAKGADIIGTYTPSGALGS